MLTLDKHTKLSTITSIVRPTVKGQRSKKFSNFKQLQIAQAQGHHAGIAQINLNIHDDLSCEV